MTHNTSEWDAKNRERRRAIWRAWYYRDPRRRYLEKRIRENEAMNRRDAETLKEVQRASSQTES